MALPVLSNQARHYADCCLSLSNTLLTCIREIVTSYAKSGSVISIGSGTGLLETLLNESLASNGYDCLCFEGVEVRSPSGNLNTYLPEELTNVVDGTWAICSRVKVATGIMFVYPRAVGLVDNYLHLCAEEECVIKLAIWLGPRCDWPDYEKSFDVAGFGPVQILEDCGLANYEMMAFIYKAPR